MFSKFKGWIFEIIYLVFWGVGSTQPRVYKLCELIQWLAFVMILYQKYLLDQEYQ
jgi:hypothetical protein